MRGRAVGSLLLSLALSACGARTTLEVGAGASRDASASEASARDAAARDSGAITFPVGTYTHCAEGVYANGSVLNSVGFMTGASLRLTQTGARVTAKYVDSNGSSSSIGFAVNTSASAALTQPARFATAAVSGDCVLGVGVSNEFFYSMEMNASAGALTYDAGTVFVSLEGKVEGDGGPCGGQAFPASLWLICDDGPAPEPAASAPSSGPPLPAGNFTCTSQIATFYKHGGQNQYIAGGGDGGALTLSGVGADVIADYSGDQFIRGTLRLSAATSTTAIADKAQTLTTACDVIAAGGVGVSETPGALPVAAGSLSIDDGTLFLSFAGVMGKSSTCAGAEKTGSLICTKN